jgi:WD40 repeat protein
VTEPENPSAPFYVTGGTLKPGAPSYVERKADTELFESLLAGEFCYVLTARQMGKSSLMARTAKRLEEEGVCAAIVDLTQIGTERGDQAASQWYFGIAHSIHRQLKITEPLRPWWQERADLPAVQRLTDFFRDVVLEHCPGRIVIFVDEIDSTISLPFADDFFAALRACFNARATDASFDRLTFALFGVASPDQLIKDQARTPFNIGKRIDLTDFTAGEAAKLSVGLHIDPEEASERMARILYWTGGHPYLTQAVCRAVRERSGNSEAGTIEGAVDPCVEDLFLSSRAQREETNLKHARARLEQPGSEKRRLLRLYLRIRQGEPISDQPASSLFSQLKLAGVVKAGEDGRLTVRNRIYESVFSPEWVNSALPADRGRQFAAATVAASLTMILLWYGVLQPRQTEKIFTAAIQADEYNSALAAYTSLQGNPFSRSRAIELMQRFWEQRSLRYTSTGDRDKGLITAIQALTLTEKERIRRQVRNIIGDDYNFLLATLHHSDRINVLAFSPNGQTVLTGSSDHTARLWDVHSGRETTPSLQHDGAVTSAAFSPNGLTILTGSFDAHARLWEARTGRLLRSLPLFGNGDHVGFSSDGSTLITASEFSVQFWKASSGAALTQPLLSKRKLDIMAFSPDAHSALALSYSGLTAQIWDVRLEKPASPLIHYKHRLMTAAFSPDGHSVLAGFIDHTAQLWDARSGKTLTDPLQHQGPVSCVSFSPDNRTLLTGSWDGTVKVWDSRSGALRLPPFQHHSAVTAAVFSSDSRTILTGSADQTARLWDAYSGEPLTPPLLQRGIVTTLAISPDGNTLLTGSLDQIARLWDAHSGSPRRPSLEQKARIASVAFSPNGRSIITGADDQTARIWDILTSRPLSQPLQHHGPVTAVAFSPGGRTVLTGSLADPPRLWDVQSGEPITPPLQSQAPVLSVDFSTDGRTLLTEVNRRTVRIWDARTRKPLTPPLQHQAHITAVALSPKHDTVLTAAGNNTARLWDISGKPLTSPLPIQGKARTVAFNPESDGFFVATDHWISTYSWSGQKIDIQSNQLLPGFWKSGFHYSSTCQHCIQTALGDKGNSINITTLNLDEPSDLPIQGTPKELLEKWQNRLGLKFDENMNLVPVN